MDLKEILKLVEELELENVKVEADEIFIDLKQQIYKIFQEYKIVKPTEKKVPEKKRKEKLPVEKKLLIYKPRKYEYRGYVEEVQIGATKSEGGSRDYVIKIGGQRTLYFFEGGIKNRPVVSIDVFDMPQPQFPKQLREVWQEYWNNPVVWAKKALEFGADLVTIHLVSTDPKIKDTSPQEAARTVENILQEIKAPIIVGGSGDPDKDPKVFEKVAEVASGERILIASASLDMDYKKVARVVKEYNHNVISWISMDINDQKMLNRLLLAEGVPRNCIVQDPTTAALGYGLEYTYSLIQRIKINALMANDKELQFPISCGVTNNWAAREAWMKEPKWGDKKFRGILWEITGAITVLSAGADLLMMLHPYSVKVIKEIILTLFDKKNGKKKIDYKKWLEV